jgi:hypothetical protein
MYAHPILDREFASLDLRVFFHRTWVRSEIKIRKGAEPGLGSSLIPFLSRFA